MNSKSIGRSAALAAFALAPGLANAHTGLGHVDGFALGFAHPIGGLDHVLAMVMVGLFASQLGGRARWLVPASFVSVMVLGGALGLAGIGDERALEAIGCLPDHLDDADGIGDTLQRYRGGDVGEMAVDALG